MPPVEINVDALYNALIDEIAKALNVPRTKGVMSMLHALFGRAARRFVELSAQLDRMVAQSGSAAAARWALQYFVKGHTARGAENIPDQGPLVIAANHPASVDSLVISAYVERPDYKIIIGDIPFFQNLPNLSRHAIFAAHPRHLHKRMLVIRESIRHLQHGGALLIFPRGGIEADPEFMSDADSEFNRWSRSLEIFLKHVPQTQVLVTMVSGVIHPKAMKHPLTWFRRARPDRQRLAFIYQMMRQILSGRELFGLMPRVTFGELLEGPSACSLVAVHAAAQRTLAHHMSWKAEIRNDS